jgi:glycosyltransferase involved in cell wall biosynthesis
MRFHVVALPNTQTAANQSSCAFTMKVFHFCRMMKSLGHTVYHYGAEGSQVECDEDIVVITKKEQEGFFGPLSDRIPDMDWTGKAPYWSLLNSRAAAEINKRKQRGDFVCIIAGVLNIPLATAVGQDVLVVEFGSGYNGTFAKYRVFESHAHMNKIYGAEGGLDPDGKFFDCVIPNYLNPDDYPVQPERGDYYLYLGRLVKRKGIHIAVETCKRLGVKLKLAGGGCTKVEGNKIYCADGEVYEGDNLEYVGFATGANRAKLYGEAIATFMPTIYLEPFGAVAIESQMTGTPVITTDFGAFPETVEQGKTGYRCHTLSEFMLAAKMAPGLNREYIRCHTISRYSMDVVKWQYQTHFQRLSDLWGDGWYAMHDQPDAHWLRGY